MPFYEVVDFTTSKAFTNTISNCKLQIYINMEFYNPPGTALIYRNGYAIGNMIEEHIDTCLDALNEKGISNEETKILEALQDYDLTEVETLIKLDKDIQHLRETVIDELEALDIQFIGLEDMIPKEYALLTRKLLKTLQLIEPIKPIQYKKPCKTKSK